jgi:hypothetical protein
MKAPTLVTSCAFGGALPLARSRGARRLRPGEAVSVAPVDEEGRSPLLTI